MINCRSIWLPVFLFATVCQCANRDAGKGPREASVRSSSDTEKTDIKIKEMDQSEKTMVIHGIFDSAGNELIKIDKPVLYNRKLSRPTPDQLTGRYAVLIQFKNTDSLKVFFDALVSGDRKEAHTAHGFFEIQIPVKNINIQSIIILETKTRKRFAEFSINDIIQK